MKTTLKFPKKGVTAKEIAIFLSQLFYEANKEYGISESEIISNYPYDGYYTVIFENIDRVPFFIELKKDGINPKVLEIQVPIQKEETDFDDIRKTVAYMTKNDKDFLLAINRDCFFIGSNQIRNIREKYKKIIFIITDNVLAGLLRFYEKGIFRTFNKHLLIQYFGIVEGKC
jgi:hypothetical protein